MNDVILHKQESGIPAVMIPTPEVLAKFSIMEIAVRDVPAGMPFKIIPASDLPNAPQETWIVDDADLTDGVGGESNAFD